MMNTPKPSDAVPPQAPTNPPAFGQQQGQKKPQAKSMQPTFLGTGTAPQPYQLGTKTLLGS